ncbi:uncharacterized protein LOC8155611 [Sorghum bicolor]|nr:uncharacterized protein LOC8155611 [Sorghum bicolor]|eukprot:XP_002489216.2 uncharacterized protein LOC8155611 [Sorghum bicolor]
MTKNKYEQQRDENVKKIQEVFKSLGIPILAQEVIDGLAKKQKGKGKAVATENPGSDHDYDPSSEIENETDSDDECDDDLHVEVNTQVEEMVPGTRLVQKKLKVGTAAASKKAPWTPTRLTRQQAAMSPGRRPPPRQRMPLLPKNPAKGSTQAKSQHPTSSSLTTNTANKAPAPLVNPTAPAPPVNPTAPAPPVIPTPSPAISAPIPTAIPSMSAPIPNREASIHKFTKATVAKSVPGANPMCTPSTPRPTAALSRHPTPATSVTQEVPIDTSPGVQSSRQSNDINVLADPFDAATTEDNVHEEQACDLDQDVGRRKEVRKKSMGHGLEKLLKKGHKLPIEVAEGKKRPAVPLQAAKLASETGIFLRDQLPIYTSWKTYENDAGKAQVQKVLDKVVTRLDVDIKNDGPCKLACTDIVKRGVRQQRYHLKRKYYDESLTKEQLLAMEPPPKMKKQEWVNLVEYWCEPKNQEKSSKNKANRALVQLHQKTGSRSYIAHHYSLEQMVAEKEKEPEEGEQQKSPTKIVAESLSHISNRSTFLQSLGITKVSKAAGSTSAAAQARMQAQFEEQLQEEREEAPRRQEVWQAQLEVWQAALEENQNLATRDTRRSEGNEQQV